MGMRIHIASLIFHYCVNASSVNMFKNKINTYLARALSFTDRRNTFRKSLKTARSEYYRSEISIAGGNMRHIYRIADSLLGKRSIELYQNWQTSHTRHSLPGPSEVSQKYRGAVS